VLSHFQQGDYILLQNEISQLPYIVSEARRRGMKVVLNPSPMNEKIGQIPLEYVDMFLLNEIEAAQILAVSGTDELPAEELIQALHDRFPEAAIVLTLGGAGAMYMDSQQFFRQPSYKVRAVDTTAAGDTFTGFFIGSIMTGLPVDEAMSQASKAAAIAVTRPGAAPSIPTYAEVEEWQFEV
jgi:ribokinase